MAKIGDLFVDIPKSKFNPLDFTALSPEKFWAHYDDLTDSIVCYFTGEPVRAVSHYIDDDSYVMVEPQSRDVVGIHIEVLEKEFIAILVKDQIIEEQVSRENFWTTDMEDH